MDKNQVGSPSNHTSNDGILSGLLVGVCSSEDEQNDEQRLPAYKGGNAPQPGPGSRGPSLGLRGPQRYDTSARTENCQKHRDESVA